MEFPYNQPFGDPVPRNEEVLGSDLGRNTGYPECGLRDFPRYLQMNPGMELQFGWYLFFKILSTSFFMYHPTFLHYSTGSQNNLQK
jgi:hypothetical protein